MPESALSNHQMELPRVPQRGVRYIGKLFVATLDLYAFGVVLYGVLRLTTGMNALWPVALVSNFLHWILLFCLPVAIILLWRRRWVPATFAIAGLIAFSILFGGYFLPRSNATAPEGSTTIVAMTYNVVTGGESPERIVEVLRDSTADIIGLQELSADVANRIQTDLNDIYPYQFMVGDGIPGKGLLSRYPILEAVPLDLANPLWSNIQAVVDVEGKLLHVFVVHPPAPGFKFDAANFYREPATNPADIDQLLALVEPSEPTILLGDFNMTDQNPSYRQIRKAGFFDTYREAGDGMGLTFPQRLGRTGLDFVPLIRIDYIWVTKQFTVLDAWIGEDGGSDHRPVVTRIALP